MSPSLSIGSWSLGDEQRSDPRGAWHSAQAPRGRHARALVVTAPCFLTPAGREAFHAEAVRAVTLHTDGARPVLEAGADEQRRPYAIVPPEEGEGLDTLLASGPLPWPEVFGLARRLLAIFAGASGQDISHGHLRARDIRRTEQGWIVEGWGISGVIALRRAGAPEDDLRRLLADQPEYTAPDLWRPGDIDFGAVDRYAIGAALYHAAAGRAPFSDGSAADILGKHRFGLTDDPMDIRPDCPPEFSAWLERMLSRAPEHRYPSFEAAADGLEAALAGRMDGVAPLAAGLSAIRRSPRRDPSLARAASVADSSATPSRRIVVSTPAKGPPAGENLRRSRRDMSGPRLFLLMLVIVGGTAAAWWRLGGTHGIPPFPWPPAESPSSSESPSTAISPEFQPDADSSTPSRPAQSRPEPGQPPGRPQSAASRPPDSSTPSRPTPSRPQPGQPPVAALPAAETGLNRLPGFTAGRNAFNEGARIFDTYRTARAWVPDLDRVPELMETAARAFETAQKTAAPEELAQLRKYVDQSYRLAMAARQAMLMHQDDPGARRSTPSSTSSSSGPSPSAARLRRPVTPAATSPSDQLRLAPSWNSVRPSAGPAIRDFHTLLRGRGTPGINLDPAPDIEFVQEVRYLAPSSEVAEQLGLTRMAGRSPVHMPAFPADSFTVLNYMVDDHSVFDSVQLVVDAFDHVVAIQWIGERPQDHIWLPEDLLDATRWTTADFLSGKPKPSSIYRLGHRVRVRPGMVQIDSEQTDAAGRESLRRQMLLLPQPIVNLLLLRLGA